MITDMVLQNRLDYGFNGYQVPAMPRATRSARRRGTVQKRVAENKMCAFDLLATVAGKLLQEESSPTSSNTSSAKDQCLIVKQDAKDESKALNVEPCDQGSCDGKLFVSEPVLQAHDENNCSKESSFPQNDDHSVLTSILPTSNCSERLVTKNIGDGNIKNEIGSFCSQVQDGSSMYRESGICKLDGEAKTLVKDESNNNREVLIGTGADTGSSEDPVVSRGKPPALLSSDSSAKAPLCVDHVPANSLPSTRDDVKVVSRDDDENSSGCTHPSIRSKRFRQAPRIGDRRIRKILASKHWKVGPKFKDETLPNPGEMIKPIYRNRKDCYKRQRSQMTVPFKKRKLFDRSSVWTSDGGINDERFFNSPEKGIGDASESCVKLQGGNGTCSRAGQNTSFQCRDSHVKLRIKSFRVPELFIEIPETATVGSLKRTVMEAVTAILGGGLRIGVLLQGKKVRDDNITLQQTGISHDNELDSLGFTLEPNPSQSSTPLCTGDSPHFLSGDAPQPLIRYSPNPSIVDQGTSNVSQEPHAANLGNLVESDHDSAPSPTDMSVDKSTADLKALVHVPEMSVDALAVVPPPRKSKRAEIAQRRIRRPFSVNEVEALVQAVEKLGTGRWRDVKLRAFDNAKHRTYVDLKDKWKTLVHTARISPQQRRGEPVPQELLDRVLTAHAYWSQQQAKQQLKPLPETCLLF
ncbi:telomere repeat-binding protein 5 isoform X1 [Morus notabilis]|uniref:telomere repeat-binding protein 5 isoform X1 n=1 Tax=Morus notabilis TaxID=981085 RepID=UPI000CED5FBF|nr:telomere repeat-binding protein 5 isoform X1 [Morus notabilis]